jgi:hypothetical protein
MSTSAPPVPTAPSPTPWRRRLAATPGRLGLALIVAWVLALVFFLAVFAGLRQHRQGLQTIGRDSAPSIIAAQGIKSGLADLHATAAGLLLAGKGGDPPAERLYEARRVEVTEALLAAAGNITYGEDERGPLRRLLTQLGTYESAVAQARLLHARADPGFLAPYRRADKVLHGELLPAADDLDAANRRRLDAEYAGERSASNASWAAILLAGLVLLAGLGVTQVFLYRRMRRVLNPGLLAASVLAAGFLVWTLWALGREWAYLKRAKEDAFDSIDFLSQARAFAYDANGDLRRALLDPDRAAAYRRDFAEKADRLAKLPAGQRVPEVLREVQGGKVPDQLEGYLAKELRNITFAGEGEAARDTLESFLGYLAAGREVRMMAETGRRNTAVARCLDDRPGGAAGAFATFDAALGRTLGINQAEFDRAVEDGFAALAYGEAWAALAALGVALLASLGLRPRLKEYAP